MLSLYVRCSDDGSLWDFIGKHIYIIYELSSYTVTYRHIKVNLEKYHN